MKLAVTSHKKRTKQICHVSPLKAIRIVSEAFPDAMNNKGVVPRDAKLFTL
jgi:hypothetical protein